MSAKQKLSKVEQKELKEMLQNCYSVDDFFRDVQETYEIPVVDIVSSFTCLAPYYFIMNGADSKVVSEIKKESKLKNIPEYSFAALISNKEEDGACVFLNERLRNDVTLLAKVTRNLDFLDFMNAVRGILGELSLTDAEKSQLCRIADMHEFTDLDKERVQKIEKHIKNVEELLHKNLFYLKGSDNGNVIRCWQDEKVILVDSLPENVAMQVLGDLIEVAGYSGTLEDGSLQSVFVRRSYNDLESSAFLVDSEYGDGLKDLCVTIVEK